MQHSVTYHDCDLGQIPEPLSASALHLEDGDASLSPGILENKMNFTGRVLGTFPWLIENTAEHVFCARRTWD